MEINLDLGGIFQENKTYDYNDYIYKEECPSEEDVRFEAVLLPVLYTIALVLGMLGNGLVLWILAQKGWRGNWSVTDTFILHLGVADSLLLFTLPFWATQAAQEQGWTFGTALCKITGVIYNINFYCGIYLLTCISLHGVVRATQMYSRRKPWMVQASCLSVWLFSLLLSMPDWIFLDVLEDTRWGGRGTCTQNYLAFSQPSPAWRLASRLLYHIVGFLVPSAVLLCCYSRILLRGGIQGLQKHRVVLALVLVFFLCWAPYNITLIVDTLGWKPAKPEECAKGRTATESSLVLTIALGCFHACLNPLLYLWLCGNFRREVLGRLRGQASTQTHPSPSLWDSVVAEEENLPGLPEEKVALNQISLVQVQSTQN